jgi:signal transduction histidine kinase
MTQDSRESSSAVVTPTRRGSGEPRQPTAVGADAPPPPVTAVSELDGPPAGTAIGRWLRANTFVPHWVPAHWRHPAAGYLLVAVLQATVAVVTYLLIGAFSSYSFPGLIELAIVALMALSWGAGPALFATLLGVAFEEAFVLPVHIGHLHLGAGELVEIALFLIAGVSVSVVASASERSRRQAVQERAAAQARELAAMRQSQERMDEFLAIASHDLRTPVTATVGFIELAARRCERVAAQVRDERADLAAQIDTLRGYILDAHQSTERLSRLVKLLFDTAQVRADRLDLRRTPCDLAELVRGQVEAVRVSAPERAIRLHTPAKKPVWVLADVDRVGQVVANYLTNALKYAPGGQPADVRVTAEEACARVAVQDRGPGLPPSELDRIWQPFQRGTGTPARAEASGGLGMGLYICKAIIEQHGGRVGVDSVEGYGATFWFTLPVAEHSA